MADMENFLRRSHNYQPVHDLDVKIWENANTIVSKLFLIFLPISYGKHSNLTAFEIKTSVLQNAWPFYVYQSDQRAIEYISLMWTLLSDWHIRFAEGCLWYLKYSLFWCLVGGISITQCYFTQYLSITTLENTGLFMIVFHHSGLFFFHFKNGFQV